MMLELPSKGHSAMLEMNRTWKLNIQVRNDLVSLNVLPTYHQFEEVHLELCFGALPSLGRLFNVRSENEVLSEL